MQPMIDIAFECDDAAGEPQHDEKESRQQAQIQVNLQNEIARVHSPSNNCTSRSASTPSISMTLVRLVAPFTIVTRDRGTRANSAKKRMHSSLALPSTGGAARSSFQASPKRPATADRLARGCTFTVRRAIPPVLSSLPRRR